MAKVSVIIPFFNSAAYIADTLHSVMQQSLFDIELLCVDDGSTDESANIVREFQKKDNRIKYYYQTNQGAGAARNVGIKNASGEYIAFMDSDDEYPNERVLELLYTKAKQNKACICGGWIVGEDGIKIERLYKDEGFVDFKSDQEDFWFTSYIYNREFIIVNACWFPNYLYYEDPVFLLKAMSAAKQFYAVCEPVYKLKEQHSSATNLSLAKLKDYLQGLSDNISIANTNNYSKLLDKSIQRLKNCFLPEAKAIILRGNANFDFFKMLININTLVTLSNERISQNHTNEGAMDSLFETVWKTSYKYCQLKRCRIIRILIKIYRIIRKK